MAEDGAVAVDERTAGPWPPADGGIGCRHVKPTVSSLRDGESSPPVIAMAAVVGPMPPGNPTRNTSGSSSSLEVGDGSGSMPRDRS